MRTPGEMMQGKKSLNTLRRYDLVPVSKLIALPLGILYKTGQINLSFSFMINDMVAEQPCNKILVHLTEPVDDNVHNVGSHECNCIKHPNLGGNDISLSTLLHCKVFIW